jgi:diguanylate cyclase (GGDEF)-like protein
MGAVSQAAESPLGKRPDGVNLRGRPADQPGVEGARRNAQIWRQLAPFLGAAATAFLLVALTARTNATELAAAVGVGAASVVLTFWPPSRVLDAVRISPALVFLVSAALLRDAAGGVASGVGLIALLPVFWVALHGTRRELSVILAGVAAYYIAPIVLVGGTAYPASGYRTAVLSVVVGVVVSFVVQQLVAQVRRHAEQLERHRHDLQQVAAVSRRIATSPDARVDVCRAACEISGATFTVLLEPDGHGGLQSTAMAGLEAAPFGSAPAGERSATRTAIRTRRSLFVADPGDSPIVNPELWAAHGRPARMLFEPVLRGEAAVGVLVVGWAQPVGETEATSVVGLLATEAAVAIERADLVEQLSDLALTDPLTGVANRRAWDAEIERVVAESARTRRPLAVALLDLDHFKAYNDSRGHQDGDRLLKAATAAWRAALRPGDIIARYGGEEFAVLLPDCTHADALAVTERVRAATPAGETCSAGVAQWDGRESADALVGRADAALYAAKAGGRDRIVAVG